MPRGKKNELPVPMAVSKITTFFAPIKPKPKLVDNVVDTELELDMVDTEVGLDMVDTELELDMVDTEVVVEDAKLDMVDTELELDMVDTELVAEETELVKKNKKVKTTKKKIGTDFRKRVRTSKTTNRAKYAYKGSWKTQFKWLEITDFDNIIVGCIICRNGGVANCDWAHGCRRLSHWRSWAFTSHANSTPHKNALKNPTLRKQMNVAKKVAMANATNGIQNNMQTVLFTVQNELPLNKIPDLYRQADFYGPNAVPQKHRSSFAVYDMFRALNAAIIEADHNKLKECVAFTVHIDESTDSYECKKMVVYVHYVDSSLDKHELFCKLIELEELTATDVTKHVIDYFNSTGVDLSKMVMFTSDGASVMLGKKKGVAAQIRRHHGVKHLISFHCVCHREALAMTDALKECAYLEKMQRTVTKLIVFVSLNKGLLALKRLADAFETVYVKLQHVFAIRWLSLATSVQSICKSYETILLALENAASTGDAKAKGFFDKLTNVRFISGMFMLNDVLAILDRACLKSQKDDAHPFDTDELFRGVVEELNVKYLQQQSHCHLSPFATKSMAKLICHNPNSEEDYQLKTTEAMEDIKGLVKVLVQVLEKRMANNSEVLEASIVFDFKSLEFLAHANELEMSQFGVHEIQLLHNHFELLFPEDEDDTNIQTEWDSFKYCELKKIMSMPTYTWRMTLKLIASFAFKNGDKKYPNLGVLCGIVQAFSAQNATASHWLIVC